MTLYSGLTFIISCYIITIDETDDDCGRIKISRRSPYSHVCSRISLVKILGHLSLSQVIEFMMSMSSNSHDYSDATLMRICQHYELFQECLEDVKCEKRQICSQKGNK